MNACSAKTDPTVVERGQASRKGSQWTLSRSGPIRIGSHLPNMRALCAQNRQPPAQLNFGYDSRAREIRLA